MIPFQKIFTLCIRTFSKPMLAYIKKQQSSKKNSYFGWFFVRVGRRWHAFEHWLNHKILKTTHKKQLTELKQQILLQKGVQAFYEVLFYSIVFGIPLYQLYKSSVSADKKQVNLNKKINGMQGKLEEVNSKLTQIIALAKEKAEQRTQIRNTRWEKQTDIEVQRDKREATSSFTKMGQYNSIEAQSWISKVVTKIQSNLPQILQTESKQEMYTDYKTQTTAQNQQEQQVNIQDNKQNESIRTSNTSNQTIITNENKQQIVEDHPTTNLNQNK